MVGQVAGVIVTVSVIGFTLYRLMIGFVPVVIMMFEELGWEIENNRRWEHVVPLVSGSTGRTK